MPLSRKRNRERMRVLRATYVQPVHHGVVQPKLPFYAEEAQMCATYVQPNTVHHGVVQPKLRAQGLKMEGNRIVGVSKGVPLDRVPLYNPAIHRPGDRVRVQRGRRVIETVIPEIDGEGNAIPDYG